VSVLLGNGDGTSGRPSLQHGQLPELDDDWDFNGDGKLDLVVASWSSSSSYVSVLLGNGDGTFQTAVRYAGLSLGSLASGDFNGDGKLDWLPPQAATP